jgi:alanyl-tRNA synthetase
MLRRKALWSTTKHCAFDFSHFEAMKPEEIRAVEDLVNAQIRRNLPIETNIMDIDAARNRRDGAVWREV